MSNVKKNRGLIVALLITTAVCLRAPITSVGAILYCIVEDLNLSNTLAGSIGTIPLIIMACFSPVVTRVSESRGMGKGMLYGMMLMIVGILLRSFGGVSGLLAGTVIIAMGITFGNVLVPAIIKTFFPDGVGGMTGVYTTTMSACSGIGTGLSVPIAVGLGLGWKWMFCIWAVAAFVCLCVILVCLKVNPDGKLVPVGDGVQDESTKEDNATASDKQGGKFGVSLIKNIVDSDCASYVEIDKSSADCEKCYAAQCAITDCKKYSVVQSTNIECEKHLQYKNECIECESLTANTEAKLRAKTNSNTETEQHKHKPMYKLPMAWALAVMFAGQSLVFFTLSAWLPTIITDRGFTAEEAGVVAMVYMVAGIPANFGVPIIASKFKHIGRLASAIAGVGALGVVVLFFANNMVTFILSAVLIQLGIGGVFSLNLALYGLKTHNGVQAAEVSAFAQSVGYILAAAGPLAAGVLYDLTAGWTATLVLCLGMMVIDVVASYIAGEGKVM